MWEQTFIMVYLGRTQVAKIGKIEKKYKTLIGVTFSLQSSIKFITPEKTPQTNIFIHIYL